MKFLKIQIELIKEMSIFGKMYLILEIIAIAIMIVLIVRYKI